MNEIPLPTNLKDEEFFVVTCEREATSFELALKTGETYYIGDGLEALQYLDRVLGDETFSGRVYACASNFYCAVVVPKEQRCFSAETDKSKKSNRPVFPEDAERIRDEVVLTD